MLLVKSRPSQKHLLRYVVPDVAPRWYDLGVELLNEEQETELEVIDAKGRDDLKKCCMDMFRCWLSTSVNANWQNLIDALRSPGIDMIVAAENIEEMLKGNYCIILLVLIIVR